MWLRASVVSCLLVFACGPKTGSDQPDDAASSSGGSGRKHAADPDDERQLAAGCPQSFAPAMHDAACEPGTEPCSYPQAECSCIPQYPCTGVDPGYQADIVLPHVWSCNVTDPTVLRADGCPAMVPSAGSKCAPAGQVCSYSPYCGGIQSTARCTDTTWQLEQLDIAPPPSAEM